MALKLCGSYALYVVAVLSFYPRISLSFFTNLEPYEEQCYHENVKKGQVWGFLYEVSEGGFLDIDAKVRWIIIQSKVFKYSLVFTKVNLLNTSYKLDCEQIA